MYFSTYNDNDNQRTGVALWVGGTSGLTRTYVNQHGPHGLILSGLEASPPAWIQALNIPYIGCDLTALADNCGGDNTTNHQAHDIFIKHPDITSIILGVRPSLFAAYSTYTTATTTGFDGNDDSDNDSVKTKEPDNNQRMIQGMERLLQEACKSLVNLQFVLHISSVAALDHLKTQRNVKEVDDPKQCTLHYPVPLTEYKASYDIFKRQCEERIAAVCFQRKVADCHIRLSGIFSDDPNCFQFQAMDLQRRVSSYMPQSIDCNSGANISRAIHCLLLRSEQSEPNTPNMQRIYYYTRPLLLPKPVPYAYYMHQYRISNNIGDLTSIWLPIWFYTGFVAMLHWLAQSTFHYYLKFPYVDACDYLMQVAILEHTFDCSSLQRDFPELQEESIADCFQRRKILLAGQPHTTSTTTVTWKKQL